MTAPRTAARSHAEQGGVSKSPLVGPAACAWCGSPVTPSERNLGWRFPIHYPPRSPRCLGSGSVPVAARGVA